MIAPQDRPQQPDTDLEYDLAHEWRAEPATARPAARANVYVATETVDTGGDYGYDLAHDVPGR